MPTFCAKHTGFFLVLLVEFVALGLGALPAISAEGPSRPNLLMVFCDDLTCQAISAYGESRHLLETPNIDRLAREGMLFERCLVTNSICGPSRATILTGKYSHRNGFYNNTNCRFDGSQTTFPQLLRDAGYQAGLIGKWHLVSDPTGFEEWNILPGQGVYYNPTMIRNGKTVNHDGYVTDLITDLSLEFLENLDPARPFLLMTQHKAPHREWSPALRHLGWNGDRPFAEPPTLFDDFAGRGQAPRDQDMSLAETFTNLDAKFQTPPRINAEQLADWNAYYEPRNEAFRQEKPSGKDLVRWRYQRFMHDYLGCVKSVDESVGRILDCLDKTGMSNETVVVLASDQGFFLGEHGWFDKRWIYEESLRTPLVVRWPGVTRAGAVNHDIVSLLDFSQTFLEIAQVTPPADMQGHSLVPLLKGDTPADWRKSLYYHYYEYPEPHRVRPHYGVVTDRYKLVHFYAPDVDEWELLDRKVDPLETRSFHDDPAYADVKNELRAELDRLRVEVGDTEPPPSSAYGDLPFDRPRQKRGAGKSQ